MNRRNFLLKYALLILMSIILFLMDILGVKMLLQRIFSINNIDESVDGQNGGKSTVLVNVENFPIQIPEKDDTARVQRAIDSISSGVVEFPRNKILTIGTIIISNKNNFRITGGRLRLHGKDTVAFKLVGMLNNLEIDHCWIKGDGVVTSGHKGIYNESGQSVTNFNYHHNVISDVIVGISLNADLSGTYDKGTIEKNSLSNILGVNPGQGYGIHLANATNINVFNNTIDKAQRHSIYQAKGGRGVKIIKNTITNHRQGIANSTYRASLNILRSNDVIVEANTFKNCFDGCILVSGDSNTFFGCKDISIINNKIVNPKNSVSAIIIGEQGIPFYLTDGVKITGNKITIDNYKGGGLIRLLNGKNIEIANNSLLVLNLTKPCLGIELNDRYIVDATHADNIKCHDNVFEFQGKSLGTTQAYRIGTKFCIGTMKVDIKTNTYINIGKYTDIYVSTVVTNPNLKYAQ